MQRSPRAKQTERGNPDDGVSMSTMRLTSGGRSIPAEVGDEALHPAAECLPGMTTALLNARTLPCWVVPGSPAAAASMRH